MTNQNKILAAISVVAAVAIGWYALRVLPYYHSKNAPEAAEPKPAMPRVAPTDPVYGAKSAPKTIIEFGDLECPSCADAAPQMQELVNNNPSIRLVWKDCPLPFHPHALAAAIANNCAGDQGKFWEYRDLLLKNQDLLVNDLYPMLASALKLNEKEFAACLANNDKKNAVLASLEECDAAGVNEIPWFFFEGESFSGGGGLANLINKINSK
jgi:protein-disulfide isomerase